MKEKGIAKKVLEIFHIIRNIDERGLKLIADEIEEQAIERKDEMKKIITLAK